jgi:hypothetical protein
MTHQERTGEMQECIDNCTSCHAVCLETIEHCLQLGGKHSDPAHIRLLADCAQICATSADFMLRMSDHHPEICGQCAAICEACAKSCEDLATGDGAEMMKRCAEICRRCAESCRRMSSGSSSSARM